METPWHQSGDFAMHFGYDTSGNLTWQQDARGFSQGFTYDKLNRQLTARDEDNHTTRFTYDIQGNLKTQTSPKNHTTTHDYDGFNRLIKTTDPDDKFQTFAYDLNDNLIHQVDRKGISTWHEYDYANRLISSTRNSQSTPLFDYFYDANGNKNKELIYQEAGRNIQTATRNSYQYSKKDELIHIEQDHDAYVTHRYDAMGNVELTDQSGYTTHYTYDERNQLETETFEGKVTAYTYTLNGQIKTKTLPATDYSYTYDAANRLKEILHSGIKTGSYGYDANGNLLTQTLYNHQGAQTTSFSYNARNLRDTITYPDNATHTYTYDANGNLALVTEPTGTVISHLYDNLDRLEQKQWVSAGNQDDLTVTYQYDDNHNRIQTTEQWPAGSGNQNKTHSYQYDNFDRLLLTTDSHGKTFTTFYYLNGQRKQFIDHDKNAIFYQIDRLNRVTTVDDRSINATTIYDYYPDSRLKSVSYANNTQSHYDYDQRGRIKRIENRQNDQLLSQFDYAYDDNDNRTKQTVINGGEEEITTYDYDNQDRLETVYYPEHTASYTYDDASNRLTEQSTDNDTGEIKANYQYQYNNRNQLTTRTDQLDATNSIQYHYDANGNQTQKIKNGITTEFTYDVRNHLRSIHEDGTALGQYQYNEQGLRTHKTGERGKINISYDDQSIIRQYDENGITQAKYSYGPNRLLSLDHATEGTQFYLTDALNSTVNLTNANGLVQARYHYDAWGNPQANKNTGDSWNRFGFTGHEHDKETNLIYAKARFYDPDIGRFLSQDAWEGELDTPPSLNKYLYAYQNPTVWIDPDGNSATAVGTALGTVWGLGQAAGKFIYDTGNYLAYDSDMGTLTDYIDVLAQNSIAGFEIGLSVDAAAFSGGMAMPASGALASAGVGSITLDGEAQGWNEFKHKQIKDSAIGLVLGPLASKFSYMVNSPISALSTKVIDKAAPTTSAMISSGFGNSFQEATWQSSNVLLNIGSGGEFGDRDRLSYEEIGRAFVVGSMGGLVEPLTKSIANSKPLPLIEKQKRISQAKITAEDDFSQPILRNRISPDNYNPDAELGISPHHGSGYFARKVNHSKSSINNFNNISQYKLKSNSQTKIPVKIKTKPVLTYQSGQEKPKFKVDSKTNKPRVKQKTVKNISSRDTY